MKKIYFVTKSHTLSGDEVGCAELIERNDVEELLDPLRAANDKSNKECYALKRQVDDLKAILERRDGELEQFRQETLRTIQNEIEVWKDDVKNALSPHFERLAEQFKKLDEERTALEAQWQAIARQTETVQTIANFFIEAFRSDLDARQSDIDRAKNRIEVLVEELSRTHNPDNVKILHIPLNEKNKNESE